MIRAIDKELQIHLRRLPENEQIQVLEYARTLASKRVRGRPGSELTRFAGTISTADLSVIQRAIEEGCEQVDEDEW